MTEGLDLKSIFAMIDNMLTGVGVFEMSADQLKLLYLNKGALRMLGYTDQDEKKVFGNFLASIIEDDRKRLWQGVDDILKDDGAVTFAFRTVTSTGGLRWISVRGNLYSKTAEKAIILVSFQDVTEQKFVEEEMRTRFSQYQELLKDDNLLFDYNVVTDVMTLSKAHQYGIVDDLIVKSFLTYLKEHTVFGDDNDEVLRDFTEATKSPKTGSVRARFAIREKDMPRLYDIRYSSIGNQDGYVTRVIGWLTDVENQSNASDPKPLEKQDVVGLDLNAGWHTRDEAEEMMSSYMAEEHPGEISAVMVVEVGDIMAIYDALGPSEAGKGADIALDHIVKLFRRHDILCKLDFAHCLLFLKNIGRISNVDALADKILNAAVVEVGEGEQKMTTSASVGIAIYPNHGDNLRDLILKAMDALEDAKIDPSTSYQIYDATSTMIDAIADSRLNKKNLEAVLGNSAEVEDVCMRLLFEDSQHDSSIRAILQIMTDHLRFQFSYLAHYDDNDVLHEYRYTAKNAKAPGNKEEDIEGWRKLLESIHSYEGLRVIHSYDALPDEISGYLIQQGIHTMLIHPLMLNGKRAGIIVMAETTGAEWEFDEEKEKEVRSIARIAQMILIHFGKNISERYSIYQLKMLDDFDSYVYTVNADTYELEFINHKFINEMQNVYVGQLCYKALHHRNSPCEDCILNKIDRKDPHANVSDAYFNMVLRKWLKTNASWMEYREDNPVALVNSIDISEYVSN
ncbi:MAG: PAS domain-containing protein [Lachnospiraceae bacterium]|nr:PAS domain-containing protein [Lachnospiraceae bacterium]